MAASSASSAASRLTWARRPLLAVILLTAVIAGGTVGYVLIEGWSWWDAFYMTAITVTTVGYREIHTLSRAGELFTVLLLFGGVGAALYTFTLVATSVVEGELPPRSASEARIDRPLLAAAPHKNAAEMLLTVPGVFVSQHGGEGKARQGDALHGTAFRTSLFSRVPISPWILAARDRRQRPSMERFVLKL